MKRILLTILGLIIVTCAVHAAPWAKTYSMSGPTVALTNQQANSVWLPVVVLWKFSMATNMTLSVTRESQGNTYLLGKVSTTNACTIIWVPEADYPFEYGDVLQVTSTVTNGQVQIIRKGD
jgi:hypothetical protein